jgi:hypothetical protein
MEGKEEDVAKEGSKEKRADCGRHAFSPSVFSYTRSMFPFRVNSRQSSCFQTSPLPFQIVFWLA